MANNKLPSRSADASNDQAFDSELSHALHSLTVPPGLRAGLSDLIQQLASGEVERSPAGLETRLPQSSNLCEPLLPGDSGDPKSEHPVEPAVAGQVESWQTSDTSAKPSLKRFRWRRLLTFASVGSAAVLLMALYFFSQPLTKEQLAAHCRAALDKIEVRQEAWITGDTSPEFWNPLKRLRLARSAQVVGYQELASSQFGQGVVWKLKSERQSFYVFEFQTPSSITDIEQELRVIDRQSGGWSFAACIGKGRVIVVAIEGEIILEAPSYVIVFPGMCTLNV